MFERIRGRRTTALATTLAVVVGLAITPAFTATAAEGDAPVVEAPLAEVVEAPATEAAPAPVEAPAPLAEPVEAPVAPAPTEETAPASEPQAQSPIAPLGARMAAPPAEPESAAVSPMAAPAAVASITPSTIGPFAIDQNINPLNIQFKFSGTDRWLSSGLPNGLSLNSSNGKLTGKLTTPGTYNVTITAQEWKWDWNWPFGWRYFDIASETYTVIVNKPAPVVSTSTLPGATVGVFYSQQLSASNGPNTFGLSQGSLPDGLSLSASGLISGTPMFVNGYDGSDTINFSVIAHNGTDSAPKQLSITVATPAPAFAYTNIPLAVATVGVEYSQGLVATGYGTLVYTLDSGNLPPGLTLSSNGIISGTPTYAATYSATQVFNFTARLTGPTGSATWSFPLTLNVTGPAITTTTLPEAWLTKGYSQAIATSGAGVILTASGVPAGLDLTGNSATGYSITGTPTTHGDFSVALTATNAGGSVSATLNLTVNAAPVITTSALPVATVGVAYSTTVEATGKDMVFTATSWTAGVQISASGVLTWLPSSEGTVVVYVTATNPAGAHTKALQFESYAVPTITSTAFAFGTVGKAFGQRVDFTGGSAQVAVTDGALPDGLKLRNGGKFTGQPTTPGTYSFEVTATNPVGTVSQWFDITVYDVPAIQTNKLDRATVGNLYRDAISFTGLDARLTLIDGTLPAGLTLSADGVISGTPTAEGTSQFRVKVENAAGSVERSYSIRSFAVPEIVTSNVDSAVAGVEYRDRISATGDNAVLTVVRGALPAGLKLTKAGVLRGTPTESGTFTFTVRAKNPAGADRQQFTITVTAPAVQLSVSTIIRGNSMTVTGSGFKDGDQLELWLHSTPVLLGTATATGGAFTSTVAIPADTAAGQHHLVVVGTKSGTHSVPLTIALPAVVAPPAPQSGSPAPAAQSDSRAPIVPEAPAVQAEEESTVSDSTEIEEVEAPADTETELKTLDQPVAEGEKAPAPAADWTGLMVGAFVLLLAALLVMMMLWRRRQAQES